MVSHTLAGIHSHARQSLPLPEVTIARLGGRDTGNFFLLCQLFREANSLIDYGARVLQPKAS